MRFSARCESFVVRKYTILLFQLRSAPTIIIMHSARDTCGCACESFSNRLPCWTLTLPAPSHRIYLRDFMSMYGCQYTAMTRGQIFYIIIYYTSVVFIFVSAIILLLVLAWDILWSYNAIDIDYYYLTAGNDGFRKRAELMRFPATDRLNIDVKIIWIWIIEWWLWPMMDEFYKRKLRYNIRVYI